MSYVGGAFARQVASGGLHQAISRGTLNPNSFWPLHNEPYLHIDLQPDYLVLPKCDMRSLARESRSTDVVHLDDKGHADVSWNACPPKRKADSKRAIASDPHSWWFVRRHCCGHRSRGS